MLTVAVCITLNESLTDIRNLLYRGPQYLYISKITHMQRSHIGELDSVRLSPSCETKIILMEIVQRSKRRTPHTEIKMILERII